MLKKIKKKETTKYNNDTYSFNRSIIPFPEAITKKAKPPVTNNPILDETNHFKKKVELTLEEQAQEYMDQYRKAERVLVINFYTGGGPYKRGILDSMYRGPSHLHP